MSTDPELEALKKEVDFNTPIQGLTEEDILSGSLLMHNEENEDNFSKITKSDRQNASISGSLSTTEEAFKRESEPQKLKTDFTSLMSVEEEDYDSNLTIQVSGPML